MRQIQATPAKSEPRGNPADRSWRRAAARWRVIAYIGAVAPLLLMVLLAREYPALNRQEIPDWRTVISRAEKAWNKLDLHQARHLYLQAARIAGWRQDWKGLVATACGINRMDGVDGPYSKAFSMLIRAAVAAEVRQSRRGITTVAKAFTAVGAEKAATAVLVRIQPSWPDETDDPNTVSLLEACSARVQKSAG
jgi:hypothetical protein